MGLADFAKGVVGAVGDVAESGIDIAQDIGGAAVNVGKGAGFVATHLDDAAKAVGNYGSEMAQGVGWLASHPGYWDDAAKQMVIDQFTDPVNIATNIGMLGLTIATGGAAAPAWAAKIGLGTKGLATLGAGAKAADTTSDVVRASRTISKVVDTAQDARKLSRLEKFGAGAQRVATKLDELQNAPTRMIQKGRSAVTGKLEDVTGGLIKQRELGYIETGRTRLATKAFGEVEDLKQATGMAGRAKRLGYRTTAGGEGKSALVGSGSIAELNWRSNRTASQITGVRDFRENANVAANVTQAVAHPEAAAKELGQAAWAEYGDEATKLGLKHAPGLAKKMFKGDKDEVQDAVYSPYEAAGPEQIKLMDFRLDGTRNTRTSKRQPGGTTELGTTTTNTTMPTQVGPSNWYGPQGGYSAGRGFRSQQPLPPLSQPGGPI